MKKRNINPDTIFHNTKNEPFKIIKEYEEIDKNMNKKCRIKFLNTGYENDVFLKCALYGEVKDPYSFDFKILNDNNIYHSNNYGDFYFVKAIHPEPYQRKKVIIHFINTGYETEVMYDAAIKGQVKDPYYPSKYGKLAIGIPKNIYPDYIIKNLYNRWDAIGNRCYNKKHHQYKNYGNKGVSMCNEWLLFESFIETIHMVEGFEKYLNDPYNYEIDKDIKQQDKEYKIYSPQTCMFVSKLENVYQMCIDNKSNNYFGVSIMKNSNYKVTLNNIYIGVFSNEIAAANAYNYFAIKYNLQFLLNNVPFMPIEEWSKYRTTFKEMVKII